jgi:carbamoyl-phosphate synthase small subunit
VVATYPLIGNYGRIREDDQSERPWLRGLVVAHATAAVGDQAFQLASLLRDEGIPAIAGVDTRALARHLRAQGSVPGLITLPAARSGRVDAARAPRPLGGPDFVRRSRRPWREIGDPSEDGPLVAIVDFGLKANIVKSLRRRGARVRILPHTIRPGDALTPDVDGLVLSPGPGDPARLDGPVALARAVIEDGRPLLGICLGRRSSRGPPARTRFGSGSGTTGRITRSATSMRASSR